MLFVLNFIIVLLALILPDELIFRYGGYLFLIQYVYILIHLLNNIQKNQRLIYLMSPSFIALTYLCLSLGFGAITLSNDLGFDPNFIAFYHKAKDNLNIINAYFLFCNYLVYYSLFRQIKKQKNQQIMPPINSIMDKKTLVFAVIIFVLFSVFDFQLSFMGGEGNFSYMPRLVTAIFIIIYVNRFKLPVRLMLYALIMVLFTITEFESKRQLLFVLLLIIWCEFIFHPIPVKLGFKTISIGLIGIGTFAYLIIISSILRGYGGYESKNIEDASRHVFEYMNTNTFKNAAVTNFEVNAVYGNSANAMDIVLSGKSDFLYGSTFLKVLFLPFPKEIIETKPKAMIEIYTQIADPVMYSKGVSYPIILYSELFWNFWYLGLPFLFLIYNFLNKSYFKAYNNVRQGKLDFYTLSVIFLYVIFIQFVRGSGLHLWLLYYIVAIPFIYFLVRNRKKKKNRMIMQAPAVAHDITHNN